jgi:hypothetical protein
VAATVGTTGSGSSSIVSKAESMPVTVGSSSAAWSAESVMACRAA